MIWSEKPSPPADLALPASGSTTARAIFSMATRRLFEDLKSMDPSSDLAPEALVAWRALRGIVASMLPGHPNPVADMLRQPPVAGPLRRLRDRTSDRDEDCVAFAANGLFELAVTEAPPMHAELERFPKRLVALSRRLAVDVPDGVSQVMFEPKRLRFDGERVDLEDPRWGEPFPVIADGMKLVLADDDADLGDRPLDEWLAELSAAFEIIKAHLPTVYGEMESYLKQVIPFGTTGTATAGTRPDAVGAIRIVLRSNANDLAADVVRAFTRTKLDALGELDPIVEPGDDVRARREALFDLLCELPVSRLRARGPSPSTLEAIQARLAAVQPTPVGRGLVDEVRRAHRRAKG